MVQLIVFFKKIFWPQYSPATTIKLVFAAFVFMCSLFLTHKHYFGDIGRSRLDPVSRYGGVLQTNRTTRFGSQGLNQFRSILNCTAQMKLIPEGEFKMGGQFEHPIRTVYISEFWMDTTEITKAEWDRVRVWSRNRGYDLTEGKSHGGDNHPVVSISWHDATKWLNAKSEMYNLRPAYYSDIQCKEIYKRGVLNPVVDWGAGFRLPTEAEWEKAGRGGVDSYTYAWTDENLISTNRCNYDQSNIGSTLPVGSFPPNGFGLLDMCGNAAEWCWDYWAPYPPNVYNLVDPSGAAMGNYRVIRGGSWARPANRCRVAFRYFFFRMPSNVRTHDLGFRAVIRFS